MKRNVGGAHYGVIGWLAQRLTGLLLAVYTLALGLRLWRAPVFDHAGWRALFEPVWMRHATLLFVFALCWHAWLGMRDVYMDYLHHTGVRLAAHTLTLLILMGCLLWAAGILWGRP